MLKVNAAGPRPGSSPTVAPWWGSMLFLALRCEQKVRCPAPLQTCLGSPGCLSLIRIRGREPQAGTGKGACTPSVYSSLNSALLLADSSRPLGAPSRNECLCRGCACTEPRVGIYLCILKSVCVGSVSLPGLKFHCKGAILPFSVFAFIPLSEAGLPFSCVAVCGFGPC